MYCRNEYYRPYSARPAPRQRPHEDSTLRRQRGPRLSPPPPPPSSSPRSTPGLLLPEDPSECTCRLSPLLKGAIFLCLLLAASAGLVMFLLTRSSETVEGGPVAEGRVRSSLPDSHLSRETQINLLKLDGFEVIKNGDYVFEKPVEESSLPQEVVTTSLSASTSTSTSQASTSTFSTSKASKTLSVLSDYFDTTIQEVEAEDNITVRPLTSTSEEVEEDLEVEEEEEFVAEVAIENSSDFSGDSEGQYVYSDYSTYGFDYSEYLDDYREGSSQQNVAVKTFTVLQESAIGTPPPSTPPPTSAPPSPPPQIVLPSPSLVTETVFGFLDFVTTVGNTVMVFTPANAEAEKSSIASRSTSLLSPPPVTTTAAPSLGLETLFDSLSREDTAIVSSSSPVSFIPTIQPSKVDEAAEMVSIIRSNFYGSGGEKEGLVAATQRTLVNNGETTVYSTEVEGTWLAGEYVQLLKSGSSVVGAATTVGPSFPGSAELTQLPSLLLETGGQPPERSQPEDSKADKTRENLEEVRKSANLSFKERLKQRFQKFREEHSSVLTKEATNQVSPREHSFGRSIGQDRDRGRHDSPKSFRGKSDIIRNKLRQVLNQSNKVTSTSILTRTFVPAHLRTSATPTTRGPSIDPSTSRHFLSILREAPTRGVIFPSSSDRFKPPEIRKNLLKKVLGKMDDVTTEPSPVVEEELPEIQSGIEEEEADEGTNLRPLVLYDNINLESPSLDFIQTSQQDISAPPQSTLNVATLPLPNNPESYLEVVTVRSPYSFDVDEQDSPSTRFITVTQTLTSAIPTTPILATPVLDNTPLFDFDGDVPNPSPVLLENIYEDNDALQPIPTNFIDFDLELDEEESINQETIVEPEVNFVNAVKSEEVENKFGVAPTPVLEPSFAASPTPGSELGLQPAQLQYLQLLGAQLTDLQPTVVTLTAPVLTTEEKFETQTLTLGLAGKEIVTTVVNPVGLTTKTSFTYLTTTVAPNLPFAPSTTLISSPVILSTVLTETDIQHYRILFRNRPITTTLTSTRLVTTQATSYVTETVTLQPSGPLLAGILG